MRRADHPGAASLPRVRATSVRTAAAVRMVVAEGDDLFETIHRRLDRDGASGAAFSLIGGVIARCSVMTGGPGEGAMPFGFHGPHTLPTPLTIVAGAGGTGVDEQGRRFTHCHAAFCTDGGTLAGGHLLAGETVAGIGGIALDLVALAGGRFARSLDPETRFVVFHPEAA